MIAALVAELIASRRFYGDAVERTRRRLPMQLAAEIVWNQLPPLTFAANDTVVTAVLEPCYDVGGDAFDYAANGDVLHVALFDTVGHGIERERADHADAQHVPQRPPVRVVAGRHVPVDRQMGPGAVPRARSSPR